MPLKTKPNCAKTKFLNVLRCSSGQLTRVTKKLVKLTNNKHLYRHL